MTGTLVCLRRSHRHCKIALTGVSGVVIPQTGSSFNSVRGMYVLELTSSLLYILVLVLQTKLGRPQCCVHYAVYARITCSVCRCRLWQVVYTYCDASSVVTSKSVRDKSYNCYTESYTPQPIDLTPIPQLLPYMQSFFSFGQHVIPNIAKEIPGTSTK